MVERPEEVKMHEGDHGIVDDAAAELERTPGPAGKHRTHRHGYGHGDGHEHAHPHDPKHAHGRTQPHDYGPESRGPSRAAAGPAEGSAVKVIAAAAVVVLAAVFVYFKFLN